MLGRHDRALDHQDVEAGLEGRADELPNALRGERPGGDHARGLDLLDALHHQIDIHVAGAVDLLQPPGCCLGRILRDAGELGVRILVPALDSLKVQNPETAELSEGDCRGRVDHTVHGRCQQGHLHLVRAQLPREIDIFGVARTAARDDCNLVKPIRPAPALATADLDLHPGPLSSNVRGGNLPPLPG